MWMHNYGFGGFGGIGMIFVGLIWLAILVGIVLLVVWLVRQFSHSGYHGGHRADDAMEILRQRYARGEITREQFEQMKKDLSS